MEHPPHTFIEELRSVALTKREREAVRAALLSKMRESGTHSIPSPWAHLFFSKRVQVGFLSAVIIMSYTSSVAFAAEGALPGDILYPIKTKVAEPVVRLVTVSTPAEEAKFETKLLERRLEEAETLEESKKLDQELKQEVRESVRAQSAKAKMKIKVVEEDDGDAFVSAALPVATSTATVATSTQKVKAEKVTEKKQDKKDVKNSVTKERGKSERALNAVLQKHERTLENLDLEDEKADTSDDKNDHENEGRGNNTKGRDRN